MCMSEWDLEEKWSKLWRLKLPYLYDSIEGRVCPNTELSAGYIVTYGGRQHTHRDAKLLKGTTSFIELQQTLKRLKRQYIEHTC